MESTPGPYQEGRLVKDQDGLGLLGSGGRCKFAPGGHSLARCYCVNPSTLLHSMYVRATFPMLQKSAKQTSLYLHAGVCVCGVSWESHCWCVAMPTMNFGHESPLPHSPVIQSPALHRFICYWDSPCSGASCCGLVMLDLLSAFDLSLGPRPPTKQRVFRSLGPVMLGYAGKLEALVGVPCWCALLVCLSRFPAMPSSHRPVVT